MMLPRDILAAIEEALASVDEDILQRTLAGCGHRDLDRLKVELEEMKSGTRKQASEELTYIIIDSMNWEQPCLQKFNNVRKLLRTHYKLRP